MHTYRRIERKIPLFIEYLSEGYSPMYSAKKAGFRWLEYRQILLQHPEIRVQYDMYMDKVEHRKNGLMGGL